MELSFGEQIKILLNRKNMTIQELADLYEQTTGSKMSRQNLAQRLKRDNFPEQDMRAFARLLGCSVSIQLTPLMGAAAYPDPALTVPTDMAANAFPAPAAPADLAANAFPAPVAPADPAANAFPAPAAPADLARNPFPALAAAADLARNASPAPWAAEAAAPPLQEEETAASSADEDAAGTVFEIPEIFRKKKPCGDINPLTGQEYLTNTVRRHPYIDDYIQVYDRTTHSWSDVEEEYFWEFQKNKRQMLGSDYQEPIRI